MQKHTFLSRISKALKDRWPLLILSALIIGLCYWALYRHYTRGQPIGIDSDFIYQIESKILDFKFMMRGPQKPTGQIGILAIDEKSVTAFGDYPFSRKFYGQALRNLKKLGVKLVAFDAIYPEPQSAKLSDVTKQLEAARRDVMQGQKKRATDTIAGMSEFLKVSPGDRDFANAIKETGNVILGFFFFSSMPEVIANIGKDKSKHFLGFEDMLSSAVVADVPEGRHLDTFPTLRRGFGVKTNLDILTKSTEHFAFFTNDADDDAINRWVNLLANIDGNLFASLGIKAAAEHMNRDILVFFNSSGVESVSLISREDESDAIEVVTDPKGSGRLLVNHRGPSRAFKHYSISDAYYNTFSAQDRKELKGMTLLLGGTATGTQDLRPNPFDPTIDGVENHAAVADNLIRRDFMKRDRKFSEVEKLIVLAVGLVFVPLIVFGSSLSSGLAVVLFLGGFWWFDWTFWFSKGIWAYTAVPSFEIITLFFTATFYKYVTEEREKKAVKGAFQHYLSPDVINQLLDDPSSMALGGTRKEITVFFSDVRSFTTISESLSPEKLCEFMNDYFTPMTSTILTSGGTLDKYIGDAIMAFWGAPLSIEDHTERAARACIQMLYELDKLHTEMPKKGFPKPDIGMGLNTTQASVGNMGSKERFSYTAMGDGVNLASRLEGLTKDYGIKIMVSESTAKRLNPKEFFLRDLDDIRVKGKNEPVKVFELVRPDLMKTTQALADLLGEFSAGRKAYTSQDWSAAEKHFMKCFMLRADDGPTQLYMNRIAEYKAQPPGVDWDGVYTFKHK